MQAERVGVVAVIGEDGALVFRVRAAYRSQAGGGEAYCCCKSRVG